MKNQNEECIIIPSKVNNTHKHKRQKRYKDFYLITLYILQKFKNAKYLCSAFVKNWVKLQKRGKSELELQISVNFFSVIENILQ
jgi:hypothetical protein